MTDGGSGDTQWVRLQAGEFQTYATGVYAFGTASLDDPTPDDNTTDSFIVSVPGRNRMRQRHASTDTAANLSVGTFTADLLRHLAVYVRGHGGDDHVIASALTYDEDTNPVSLTVLDGSGHDTITGRPMRDARLCRLGRVQFHRSRRLQRARSVVCGQAEFYFAGDSSLGSSDITITGPGAVGLNLTSLASARGSTSTSARPASRRSTAW